MKKYLITKNRTSQGNFITGLWTVAFLIIASFVFNDLGTFNIPNFAWMMIVLSMAILTLFVLWPLRKDRIIRERATQLAQYAIDHKLQYAPGHSLEIIYFGLMSLADLKQVRGREYRNFISADDWQYTDFSYKLFEKVSDNEYHAASVYYSVITTKLPRALPNVFFDSLKSRRRQFRFHFSHKQRHSLEGNFDKHFVTYFPQHYTIDSLSFISPDVMEALIAAEDYDIEIVGDRIFMYGPLLDVETQLSDMTSKLAIIRKQLMDNILTYRDERIAFHEGRQRVSVLGATLQRSTLLKQISIILVIIYIVLFVIIQISKFFA